MKPFIKTSIYYISKLTPQKEKIIIEEFYKNPKYGLLSANKLTKSYEVLKAKNLTKS